MSEESNSRMQYPESSLSARELKTLIMTSRMNGNHDQARAMKELGKELLNVRHRKKLRNDNEHNW